MDLSRQEYPALLATLQPNQAVNVLNDRVKLITTVNTSIADWLQERRKVEETYVQGLQKLARRPQQDGAAALGIFQMPWQRIVSGTENLAQSHEMLAQKIETDVETPLRQFATKNREMQSMTTIQGNLAAIAKDFDNAQKKAEKLRDRSGKGDRIANATSNVGDASQQWESQAPYVFEQLQSLDETRVNFLRDALTQFQTHEVDQVERNRTSAESCLNALLNIETADEIKTFAAKISGGRDNNLRRRSSAATAARPQSAVMAPPPTPPSRGFEDSSSSRFGTPGGQDRLMPIEEKSKKSSFGGIKRIGTVMSRRKSTAPPVPTPEKRKEKSRFPFRRGDSSRSFQEVDSPPPNASQGLTPVTSYEPDPVRPPSQYTRGETNGLIGSDGAADAPRTNGDNFMEAPITRNMDQPLPQIPQELSAAPYSPSSPPATYDESQNPVDAITRAQEEARVAHAETEEASRNLKIRDKPIAEDETEAQRAMNNMASQLRMQAQTTGRMPSVRGRRDVRNTMFVPNLVVPPGGENTPSIGAAAAMSSGAAATVAGGLGIADLVSPIKRAETPGTVSEDRALSDSTSVHSGHGLAGLVHHPELHEPGLNASIVETVTTTFSDGNVAKSFVVGEVALAFNPTSEGSDPQTDTVRLENFHELEKVAANPAFVTPVVSEKGKERAAGEDRAGEYSVTLSAIRRPAPTVALKYQLHVNEANLSAYSPVLFTPAWQIQDSQASVIVVYAINPAFAKPSPTITLKNVVITVGLDTAQDGGKAMSAMMAPTVGASFKRKQSLVVWRLPELVVDAEQKKLLARFITTGSPPKAGKIEAKWELPSVIGSGLSVSSLAGEASDPFADESANAGQARSWNTIPCAKKLVSGRYSVS